MLWTCFSQYRDRFKLAVLVGTSISSSVVYTYETYACIYLRLPRFCWLSAPVTALQAGRMAGTSALLVSHILCGDPAGMEGRTAIQARVAGRLGSSAVESRVYDSHQNWSESELVGRSGAGVKSRWSRLLGRSGVCGRDWSVIGVGG